MGPFGSIYSLRGSSGSKVLVESHTSSHSHSVIESYDQNNIIIILKFAVDVAKSYLDLLMTLGYDLWSQNAGLLNY